MLPTDRACTAAKRGVRRRNGLDNAHDYSRSSKQRSGIPRGSCLRNVPCADQHGDQQWIGDGPSRSARGATRNTAPPIVSSKRKGTPKKHRSMRLLTRSRLSFTVFAVRGRRQFLQSAGRRAADPNPGAGAANHSLSYWAVVLPPPVALTQDPSHPSKCK
jgi:hypothetical protein